MNNVLAGLLLFAVALLAVGCGAAKQDAASPSPSPSATVLTKADLLRQFLADVKPIRHRYRTLEGKLDHAIWDEANMDSINSTWPPAGRKVVKLTQKYDGIMSISGWSRRPTSCSQP